MKRYCFLFGFLIIITFNFSDAGTFWDRKEVLEPEPSLGRVDPVLKNIAYVRLTPEGEYRSKEIIGSLGAEIIKQVLPDELSLTHNQGLAKTSVNNFEKAIELESPLLRTYVVEYSSALPPELFCRKAEAGCSLIECAEPYYLQTVTGQLIPNDTLLHLQDMLPLMQVFEAWDIYKGSPDIVIGISDSGVMQDHEDLKDGLWENPDEIPGNGIDDDGNGFVDDYRGVNFSWADDTTHPGNTFCISEGHGTGTAGISSAVTNNITGLAGLSYECRMFPMKTSINWRPHIIYGYESILYAALNNIHVVNCSWGSRSYSCTNDAVVEYSVARGLAIVAGAGNHGTTAPFYPAAYDGVMGVGVTDPRDTVIPMSALGYFVDIMTPGQQTRTTTNDGSYGLFCCTSGASPIAAAAVAMARGLHPDLGPEQAIEFVRLCTDPIEEINPNIKSLIPGRLNLLDVVTKDPFAMPSIRPLSVELFSNGEKINRITKGDTVEVIINAYNHLGEASDISVSMSTVGDSLNALKLIEKEFYLESVPAESELTLTGFEFELTEDNSDTPFLRFEYGNEDFSDFFLIPITPTKKYTTFSNDKIEISLVDNGRLGFADPPMNQQGEGFALKPHCNMLFESGFMVMNEDSKIVHNTRKAEGYSDDFMSLKPFESPEENIGIFSDAGAEPERQIGVRIKSKMSVPDGLVPYVRLDMELMNISAQSYENLSVGYYTDWDIGFNGDSNFVELDPSGVPPALRSLPALAAKVSRIGSGPSIGILVLSEDRSATPQLASFSIGDTYRNGGFTDSLKKIFLSSHHQVSINEPGDIGTVYGMRFNNQLAPGEKSSFRICLCADEEKDNINEWLWKCALEDINSVVDSPLAKGLHIFPNPASAMVTVKAGDETGPIEEIRVYNMIGAMAAKFFPDGKHVFSFSTSMLPHGVYFLRLTTGSKVFSSPLIILNK